VGTNERSRPQQRTAHAAAKVYRLHPYCRRARERRHILAAQGDDRRATPGEYRGLIPKHQLAPSGCLHSAAAPRRLLTALQQIAVDDYFHGRSLRQAEAPIFPPAAAGAWGDLGPVEGSPDRDFILRHWLAVANEATSS